MEKLKFKTEIKASKEKVWKVLWNDETNRKCSSVFAEGSHAVSDWNEGSKIYFLSPSGEGMWSIIEKIIPNEYMRFKNIGELKEGKEVPTEWSGFRENYTLSETEGVTDLTVEIDIIDEYKEYFSKAFPVAINKVKEISES
ncbi:MAG TPA: SRPBCC domain-containing protein [Ignavibacteria bacterium]|nr:SRPBCC domain-containing protein [Ignavibacteria bacterium]